MDFKREQQHLRNTITTLPQFLTWFGNWALEGDQLKVAQVNDEDKEERVFLAFDKTGYLVAEFSEQEGLRTYK